MPDLANRVPGLSRNAKANRIRRAERLFAFSRITHPAMLVVQLRREERQLQRDFWDKAATLDDRCKVHGALIKCRTLLLDMIGWPKRPNAKEEIPTANARPGDIILHEEPGADPPMDSHPAPSAPESAESLG
jgi:hypothetical protein